VIARREDEPELLAFFDSAVDETIWLRICWTEGERFAVKREGGRIVAVSTHAKNGALHVFGASGLNDAVNEAVSERKVVAVAGPPEQMKAAIDVLGFGRRRVARLSQEIIMGLDLAQMVMPEIFHDPKVLCRRASVEDLPLLTEWRVRYFKEVHDSTPGQRALSEVGESQAAGRLYVLVVDGQVVNTSALSAVIGPLAQVEYAYGPPELRAKKYGRSACAGALAHVRGEGVTHGVLNTDHQNHSVYNAVYPLGFRKVADYHVTVFGD
jgi:hypothetical protein